MRGWEEWEDDKWSGEFFIYILPNLERKKKKKKK